MSKLVLVLLMLSTHAFAQGKGDPPEARQTLEDAPEDEQEEGEGVYKATTASGAIERLKRHPHSDVLLCHPVKLQVSKTYKLVPR